MLAAYPDARIAGLMRQEAYVAAFEAAGLHEVVLGTIKDADVRAGVGAKSSLMRLYRRYARRAARRTS